jgi:hypothetical protein
MSDGIISHQHLFAKVHSYNSAIDDLVYIIFLAMATFGDKRQFLGGQLFGSTYIPNGADLSGKTVIVTGANTGIGLECAKHL